MQGCAECVCERGGCSDAWIGVLFTGWRTGGLLCVRQVSVLCFLSFWFGQVAKAVVVVDSSECKVLLAL